MGSKLIVYMGSMVPMAAIVADGREVIWTFKIDQNKTDVLPSCVCDSQLVTRQGMKHYIGGIAQNVLVQRPHKTFFGTPPYIYIYIYIYIWGGVGSGGGFPINPFLGLPPSQWQWALAGLHSIISRHE